MSGFPDDAESSTARTIRLIRAEGFSAGYAEAVARLRDGERYRAWMKADQDSENPGHFWPYVEAGPRFADYLEADATKETADHA